MKIVVHFVPRLQHQKERADRLVAGFKRHGYNNISFIAQKSQPMRECDLVCFWGMHGSEPIIKQQQRTGKDFLVMERGYVGDRFHWTSLGYNGLNGHADFCNTNIESVDRWDKLFSQYHVRQYWKPIETNKPSTILLAAQILADASIKHLRVSYQAVLTKLLKVLPQDANVVFRDHPLNKSRNSGTMQLNLSDQDKKRVRISNSKDSLYDLLLKEIDVTVVMNSNTAVDSLLHGVPVITLAKGSMVEGFSGCDYSQVNDPPRPDLTEWTKRIAYTQWSPEEIANGDAWDHLKQKYENK